MDTSHDNLKTVLDAGANNNGLRTPSGPNDILVVPHGYVAKATEELIAPYLEAPRRIKANVRLTNVLSFIEYANAFKETATRIFADTNGRLVCVFDYHTAPESAESDAQAQWCEHRATFEPVKTEEWTRWSTKNKQRMNQTQLAEFLEENQELIVEPKGADLLELVQTLEGKNHIDCKSLIRLANGRTKLDYSEEVELRGATATQAGSQEFPAQIVAGISPFEGISPYKMRCRMRYRIEERRLVFWYEMVDPHLIIKEVIEDSNKLVKEETGMSPLFGTP